MSDYGYEAEAIEDERRDADREYASLVAAGNASARGHRRMLALRTAGKLAEAASHCHHGWGYPTDSLAATHATDPRAGQVGQRCLHCGSWWSGLVAFGELRRVEPTVPCELEARA